MDRAHFSSFLSYITEFLFRVLIFSVARRGEFSRFVGFLAQKGGQIFEDGDLWELFKKGGILKNFTKIGKFSYFSTKC